ncbi:MULTISPECIES: hypothetical protein [unclassified Bacillus (in: firmicutes)]|nr:MULTISPECIES: hypothetical protein [unclassified Bacillus (in: firmicutes)]CAH0346694.1 hypothetical protein BCI9360_03039 [Bacillus sp. CECT 9360]
MFKKTILLSLILVGVFGFSKVANDERIIAESQPGPMTIKPTSLT